jgi:molybdenum cofactor cytidylyltransferase
LGRRFFDQLMQITDDIGARQLIDDHPDQVLTIEIDDPLCFFDIDTPQDFKNLKKKLEAIA